MPLFDGPPRPFLGDDVFNAAWAPDGTRLVYQTDADGDPLFVADRNGSNPTKIFERDGTTITDLSGHPMVSGSTSYTAGVTNATHEVWRIQSVRRPARGHGAADCEGCGVWRRSIRAPCSTRPLLTDGAGPWLWALDVETRTSRRVSWGARAIHVDRRQRRWPTSSGDSGQASEPASGACPSAVEPPAPLTPGHTAVPGVRAWGPRVRGTSLFYLSAQGTGDGLWRYRDGQSVEIWRGSQGALSAPAAVSPDGLQAAIVLRKEGRRTLTLVRDGRFTVENAWRSDRYRRHSRLVP